MIALPMSPATLLAEVVTPALDLLPKNLDSRAARVMLVAIAQQESGLRSRWQMLNGGGKGPARGLWQFEQGSRASRGGVWGVYLHSASSELLRLLCRDRDCNFDPAAIWSQLERDDVLAAAVARLMLLTDRPPLPDPDDQLAGWKCYLRVWGPGKPHPEAWPEHHLQARQVVA